MKISTLLISMIVSVGILLGLSSFYSNMAYTYTPSGNSTSESTFITSFNKSFEEINMKMDKLTNKTTTFNTKQWYDITKWFDIALIATDAADVLAKTGSLVITFGSTTLAEFLPGIPWWFKAMTGTILVIIFAVGIAMMVIRMEV